MERFAENPLITPTDVSPSRPDFVVVGTFNAGAARCGGEVILLLRVAERPSAATEDGGHVHAPFRNADSGEIGILSVKRGDPDLHIEDERVFRYRGDFYLTSISHLRVARSADGIHFTVGKTPAMEPESPMEAYGIEDPRITEIDGEFLITYKAVSASGIATALAGTRDFRNFVRHGVLFCPENLDVVIFPERIHGAYAAWTRPVGVHQGAPSIWLARSDNLIHWGAHEPVMSPRDGCWDSSRIGSSCVPFRIDEGWMEIYHGADSQSCYRVGAVLVDGDNPARVLARSRQPLLEPRERYEKEGFFNGVVFPCGHVSTGEGQLTIYYGAADAFTCGVPDKRGRTHGFFGVTRHS